MLFIRSLCFYLGQAISTLVFVPVCLLVYPLSFATRYYIVTRWTVFNLWWLELCCGVHYRIEGEENIPEQPGIVMCKHQSAWETLALQLLFIPQVWILKRELSSAIKSFRQIVEQGCERLNSKLWVIIFPEGTRIAPGSKKKYLPGGGLLAEKSGAMITPVAHNAGYLWPRNSFIKQPGTITMVIGPPINPAGKSASAITREVEEWIETSVESLPDPRS